MKENELLTALGKTWKVLSGITPRGTLPMPTAPSPRMSLLGLQFDEEIVINSGGFIWRRNEHTNRATMSDPNRRLQAATGLKIHGPADVYALAMLLGEYLRAAGQPFALRFHDVDDERGNRVLKAWDIFHALRALDDFRARPLSERGDDEVEPEIPEVEWNPLTYYEAQFKIVLAPEK